MEFLDLLFVRIQSIPLLYSIENITFVKILFQSELKKNENGIMIETVSRVVVDLRTFPRLPDILRKQLYDLDLTLNDFCYLNDSTQMP